MHCIMCDIWTYGLHAVFDVKPPVLFASVGPRQIVKPGLNVRIALNTRMKL
jgi:hypothetical protein